MNTNVRSVLALAALLAIGARSTVSPRYASAADLPSAGSALLGEQQPGTATAGAPKAEVAEPAYNFGTALSGPPINHVFMIKNVGNATARDQESHLVVRMHCRQAEQDHPRARRSFDHRSLRGHALRAGPQPLRGYLDHQRSGQPVATAQARRRDQTASGGTADGRGLRQRPSRQRGRPRGRR